jgi:hypothetical protein
LKINILLAVVFLSFTLLAYSGLFETDRIGGTELNGNGCVCHSLYEDSTVVVWVEGPETLAVGQTGLYKMFLTGGPAEAGGYNVAGRFGTMSIIDTISVWDYRAPNELTQAFPLVFPTPQDTIFWPFAYTATDSSETDTIYSCGLSLVYDSIPDFSDRWGFGPKFPLTIVDATPVELTSFNVDYIGGDAILKWVTASELNNKGFEIQRLKDYNIKRLQDWKTIGFVGGKGTTSNSSEYIFIDKNLDAGNNLYRLKQIDYDGRFEYSDIVELNADILFNFELDQNYPNPFNPSTVISWQLAVSSHVLLKVYDVLGNEVATLVNETKSSGRYEVVFDGANFSSGLYLYELKAGKFSEVKKMLLLK